MIILKRIIQASVFFSVLLTARLSYGQSSTDTSAGLLERQVIASTGKYSKANTCLLEWTVGESMITTITGNTHNATQGFNQPSAAIVKLKSDDMTIYPNPTTTTATVKYRIDTTGNKQVYRIDIKIVNIQGQIIFTDYATRDTTQGISSVPRSAKNYDFEYNLNSTKFYPGIYFVTLIMDTGIKATRKLLKMD